MSGSVRIGSPVLHLASELDVSHPRRDRREGFQHLPKEVADGTVIPLVRCRSQPIPEVGRLVKLARWSTLRVLFLLLAAVPYFRACVEYYYVYDSFSFLFSSSLLRRLDVLEQHCSVSCQLEFLSGSMAPRELHARAEREGGDTPRSPLLPSRSQRILPRVPPYPRRNDSRGSRGA